ncbi:AAA family ATPase [Phocicoccus pinnipedialis]|uniref:Replication factor C small subunit n=1 Tax=Phocicoccus pinnipedialis TaxID=110845 RepID=A0A6V7RI88_9BACL|nr:MoxR family ATPase [Jeotgalicoccus pinnipedialis]MBP1938974.1 MoxR-like ATPase [Jeotgalicoccus pinnipedialis]CAD2077339.1 replication factor C small subunit [Jeotgalicoccus pinnipedialis]
MDIRHKLDQFNEEISKVFISNRKTIDLIFISLLREGHILFESVPGTGKTVLSKAIARAIGGEFKRIQFTPDVLPTDITGMNMYNIKEEVFELKLGPIDTNVLLADEINRATPRTQSALLEVMEESQVTIDGERIELKRPFIVLATQNPIESSQGTFDLPEAQLDRFLMKIDLDYPNRDSEMLMMDQHMVKSKLEEITPVFTLEEIKSFQNDVYKVEVNETVKNYILDIVGKTRKHPYVDLGVSPRGTLHIMNTARAVAFINGRNYVTPQDVKDIVLPVISHRIMLSIEGMTVDSPKRVAEEIVRGVEVPVETGVVR